MTKRRATVTPPRRLATRASAHRLDRPSKQQALRSQLIAAGLDLFRRQGFENTTVSEIAEAVGTSRRTFFRYFASKDDVVFDWIDEQGKFVRTLLATMPSDTAALAAMHEALLKLARFLDSERDKAMLLTRIVFETPTLDRRYHAENSRWESEVTDFLMRGRPKADMFMLRVQISAASSAFVAAMRAWAEDNHGKPLLHWVTAAFHALASGLADIPVPVKSKR